MKTTTTRNQRIRKWMTISLVVVLLIPGLQVACLWFVNPPTTGPMVLLWYSGKESSEPYVPKLHQWVRLDAVSRDFCTAVWRFEDRHFFEHWGFDFEEIQKALAAARASGKPTRGASTITQQCARSLFLWQKRSWVRKGLEAYYTLWMELLLSKRRIFEVYVNVVECGDGVFGIEAAAQHHYGVSAKALSREQAVMLATILPQPRGLDPNHPTKRMLWRQTRFLKRAKNVVFPLDR